MKTTDLETRSAGFYAYAAALDARMTSTVNASHFSDAQKLQAERMRLALELCYAAKGFHVNPREKFISIKVDKPQIRDRKQLRLLESDWAEQGIVKIATAQGVTYRVAKK
jgi:hypothetical protein